MSSLAAKPPPSRADEVAEAAPGDGPARWTDRLGRVLARYDEPLLRQVAARLIKPRSQWPVAELIERILAAVGNPAALDRRLKDLGPAERRLLALVGHSRQPHWKIGRLLELLAALGHAEGLEPIRNLFESGLLYPCLSEDAPPLKGFEPWLGQGSVTEFAVFAHPQVTERALGEDLGLPELPAVTTGVTRAQEADGLEWPLRLAALWQQVAANPLRRTQNEGFFKRDLDRLRADPLLNSAPAENLAELPDASLLAVLLGLEEGLLQEKDGELRAGRLPVAWEEGLLPALACLWSSLPGLDAWGPEAGWLGAAPPAGNPYPSALLLALLLLARQLEAAWLSPAVVARRVVEHHPYWGRGNGQRIAEDKKATTYHSPLTTYLLGFAYHLRLLQAGRDAEGQWVVRLSSVGRWLLGLAPMPTPPPAYPQTLLVQPNLEILAYRQGLTPPLVAALTRFAAWKTLGSACTLQLQPDTVYRALESGETFDSIRRTLDRHGMKATPTPVIESLKTWANKHERISVYPSAVLLEFSRPEDLNEALARGLQAVRLSDKLAVVTREADVHYPLFRLTGTRDYGLPPDKCVEVEPDGVTLTIDLAKSDLLLETEVQRFAEPLPAARPDAPRRQYRLTPESLAAGRESGLSLTYLEGWFVQRAGRPLSPAARLLLTGRETPPPELRRLLVLSVPNKELADGLLQWPATRGLIRERLGPTALVVGEDQAEELNQQLRGLGIEPRMHAD